MIAMVWTFYAYVITDGEWGTGLVVTFHEWDAELSTFHEWDAEFGWLAPFSLAHDRTYEFHIPEGSVADSFEVAP